jgi:two-component system, chemotaxis family, sensor kinase CheA
MHPADNEFMRELMAVFAAEADERLSTIDQHLVAFERTSASDERQALLQDIKRELHTLKGSSGAVNLVDAGRVAHALEHVFNGVDPEALIDATTIDVAYQGLDGLRQLISSAGTESDSGVDLEGLLATLEHLDDREIVVPATQLDGRSAPDVLMAAAAATVAPVPIPAASLHTADETAHFESALVAPASSDDVTIILGPTATPTPAPDVTGLVGRLPTADPPAVRSDGMPGSGGWMPPPPGATVAAPETAAAANEPRARRATPQPADETVRLTTSKLDSLMARVGELVVARIGSERRVEEVREVAALVHDFEQSWRNARPQLLDVISAIENPAVDTAALGSMAQSILALTPLVEQNDLILETLSERLRDLRENLEGDERRFGQVTSDLEDEVRRTRMLPISTIFDPFRRTVRDLCRTLGKECDIVIHGGDTEVDRSVLEQMRGSLTHLIRNSLDHGMEAPSLREMNGKPREGTIRLAASERGGTLHLSVTDDGGGIAVDQVRITAIESGLVTGEQMRTLTERDCLRLIFRSGLSTNDAVTDISGRGVGLDVVRETVERLNGVIDVSSEIGVGTTFTMSLPLSVATTQSLLIKVSHHTFALPIGNVSRIVQIGDKDIQRAQGREMIVVNDGPIVLTRLEDVLQLTTLDSDIRTGRRKPAIIVGQGERRFALLVDELIGTQDIVVKPLPRPFVRVRHTAGATALGTGEVVIVLNASDLIRTAVRTAVRMDAPVARREPGVPAARTGGTVLVVDDSIVTRMLEKSILEAAGYTVRVAADGLEAWKSLENETVDVIVSDVNMPNMDGLALTARVRSDARTKDIPVVIVTSLDASDDHARAMEVGADAYIVKSSFSQESLLQTVGRLV